MERKRFDASFTKVIDADQGIVDHYIAVMGNVDDGMDRIANGAFLASLASDFHRIRVVDQHRTDSVLRVLGKPLEIREVGRDALPADMRRQFPDATGALFARTQFLMDVPEGIGVFKRIKSGAVGEYSIGYDTTEAYPETLSDGRKIRVLKTCRLWEYSAVLWGMNPATRTVGFKGGRTAATARDWELPAKIRRAQAEMVAERAQYHAARLAAARRKQLDDPAVARLARVRAERVGFAALDDDTYILARRGLLLALREAQAGRVTESDWRDLVGIAKRYLRTRPRSIDDPHGDGDQVAQLIQDLMIAPA